MKYSLALDIELPRARVIELYDNPDNLRHWQPELMSYEIVHGVPGQLNSKTRQRHRMGKREIEMIETVVLRDLPERLSATYEADGVWNRVDNNFQALTPDNTKWTFDSEFRCTGLLRLMTLVAPGMFKKQSLLSMQRFKTFAESHRK